MVIFERQYDTVRVVCVKCKLNAATVLDDGSEEYWGRLLKIGWCAIGKSDTKFTCPVCVKHLIHSWGVPYRKTRKMTHGPGYSAKDRKILEATAAIEKAPHYSWPSIN